MIICLCAGINEKTIRSYIKNGSNSLNELRKSDICNDCKKCRKQIEELLNEYEPN